MPDSYILFWITASADDEVVVDPNGIQTLLANGLKTFFIKGKPAFSNGLRGLTRIYSNCAILDR